jgi:hypothetical protein
VAASVDVQVKKKAIYDTMSPRQKRRIDRKGYEKWDPFEEPKDPIDIRRDQTKRTTQQLVREFLQNCGHEQYSNAYGRGVLEIALGIINSDDRFIGMYEFACWYQDQLKAVTDKTTDS